MMVFLNIDDFKKKKITKEQTNPIIFQQNDNTIKTENKDNENLITEIRALKKENENLKKKVQSLNNENQILKNENANLKKNLDNLNEEKIKELNEKLKKLIEEKKETDNYLASKLDNNTSELKNYNELPSGEKLVAVNFISVDQRVNHSIVCKNKTNFFEIENSLYKKYPEYSENDNFFMFHGLKINRWKTLQQNGINGYTIILNMIDDK